MLLWWTGRASDMLRALSFVLAVAFFLFKVVIKMVMIRPLASKQVLL